MNFPLQLHFKFFAFAPQIYVTDTSGAQVFYIKQKLFKLKEAINVFSDETQKQQVAAIKADRILDFNARYAIADENGQLLGAIGRKGMRSFWSAHYELFDATGQAVGSVREENPFAKVMDSFLSEIPIVGLLSGFFFHPRYVLSDASGTPLLRLRKLSAFLEGRFEIAQLDPRGAEDTRRNVLSLLMLVLLERRRG